MNFYKRVPVEGSWGLNVANREQTLLTTDLPKNEPVTDSWEPLPMTGLWSDMGRRMHRTDVPSYVGLVFPDSVLGPAREILGGDGEFLRLEVRHEGTYWYYHCTTVIDALDVERSTVKRFSDGGIMWVDAYAFRDDMINGHMAFQVPEVPFTFSLNAPLIV